MVRVLAESTIESVRPRPPWQVPRFGKTPTAKSRRAEARSDRSLLEVYDDFRLSVPHHDDMQNLVGKTLDQHLARLGNSGGTLLEAGTGTGFTTDAVASRCLEVRIITTDPEKVTQDQARVRLHRYGRQIEFVPADILTTLHWLPDASIDGFFSAYTLHNLADHERRQILKELARVLKPGAPIVNADKIARDQASLHAKDFAEQIAAFGIYKTLGRATLAEEWTKHYYQDDRIKLTEAAYLTMLRDCDITDSRVLFRERMEAVIYGKKAI